MFFLCVPGAFVLLAAIILRYWVQILVAVAILAFLFYIATTSNNPYEVNMNENSAADDKPPIKVDKKQPVDDVQIEKEEENIPALSDSENVSSPVQSDCVQQEIEQDGYKDECKIDSTKEFKRQNIDIQKDHYEAKCNEKGVNSGSVDCAEYNRRNACSASAILDLIKKITVYSKLQSHYGNGNIVRLNFTSNVASIKFGVDERYYDISFIGKTILAARGGAATEELINLIEEYRTYCNEGKDVHLEKTENKDSNKSMHISESAQYLKNKYDPALKASPYYDFRKAPARFYYQGKVRCFDEEWISRRVNVERTKSRGELLYQMGSVLSLRKDPYKKSYMALVRGSAGNHYHCGFSLDDNDQIHEWFCDCPAFSTYPKACKHLVAVFYAAREHNEEIGQSMQQAYTDTDGEIDCDDDCYCDCDYDFGHNIEPEYDPFLEEIDIEDMELDPNFYETDEDQF